MDVKEETREINILYRIKAEDSIWIENKMRVCVYDLNVMVEKENEK